MIINNNIQALSSVYASTQPTQVRRAQHAAAPQTAADQFEVSHEAQSFSDMLQELQSMSDVRQDKVDAVAEQLAAGTYEVSNEDVAARLLNMRY
jgi:negative regulator of flagellin synthesis FlgM